MWSYNYEYDNYLCHWGVKGMRWGQRRYQNKDGSLTPSGVKRYRKLEDRAREIEAEKTALVGAGKPRTSSGSETTADYARAHSGKGVSSLTDQELSEINRRLATEKQYYENLAAVKKATYKPTLGRRIMDVGKQAVTEALTEWGKNTLKSATKSLLETKTKGLFDDLADLAGKKGNKDKKDK